MSENVALLAACGLYCGACYHYRASLPGGQHLLAEAASRGRPATGYTCHGCRSERLYVHPGCAECQIRECADSRQLAHCGECSDLPCARLIAFQADGRVHHLDVLDNLAALVEQGVAVWLERQAARWRCGCGAGFSWYETVCPVCGVALASYGPDPLVKT